MRESDMEREVRHMSACGGGRGKGIGVECR